MKKLCSILNVLLLTCSIQADSARNNYPQPNAFVISNEALKAQIQFAYKKLKNELKETHAQSFGLVSPEKYQEIIDCVFRDEDALFNDLRGSSITTTTQINAMIEDAVVNHRVKATQALRAEHTRLVNALRPSQAHELDKIEQKKRAKRRWYACILPFWGN